MPLFRIFIGKKIRTPVPMAFCRPKNAGNQSYFIPLHTDTPLYAAVFVKKSCIYIQDKYMQQRKEFPMSLKKDGISARSRHELGHIKPVIDKIESYKDTMHNLTDEELRAKTDEFKKALSDGKKPDSILSEAFAVVREAARRTTGMEPFRVQLEGAVILYQGRIAEMKTGEGKTLVAAMPAYMAALEGKGVHIITVNDYLAGRDAAQIGKIHEFLGLTVGCILSSMKPPQRREAYACDITYVTNNEAGFDYLRDNMVRRYEDKVQRGLHYAIIDEVDSVLIDEARTPLIISGQGDTPTDIYRLCDACAKSLEKGRASAEFSKINALMGEEITETGDYVVNEKEKTPTLTERGVHKVEKYFGIENLSDAKNVAIQHGMVMALKANSTMHRDQDYVVRGGEILIVDEFTGRIMPGRRYSDGLHQAIEAKEGVDIKRESQTLATVTFQNFFNKYEKKAGMTGTALTEEQEFREIYGMDVIEIPTNKPVIRDDRPDAVFLTKDEKYKAVCSEIDKAYKKRQPVLVGTVNIDTSEMLSRMLSERGIPHRVLNAKNDAKEAEIVSHAGEAGTVTIATNMAGRGTDIKLDDEARSAGGLLVVGTERHESRRIDNQLRGRSGRQGDPGASVFYLSMEDDILRIFGSEKMKKKFETMGMEKDARMEDHFLTASIRNAQKKIEDNHYGMRKSLLDYDIVNNEQREKIYAERDRVLQGNDMRLTIMHMIEDLIAEYAEKCKVRHGINTEKFSDMVFSVIPTDRITMPPMAEKRPKTIIKDVTGAAKDAYAAIEEKYGTEEMRNVERQVLLMVIDEKWKTHLDNLDQLKQWMGIQAYGQKDPKTEYRLRAYRLFRKMANSIREETLRILYGITEIRSNGND